MENYTLEHDLKLYGFKIDTFPSGIQEGFDHLISLLPPDPLRPYYGLSQCTPTGIVYHAAAPLQAEEEPEKYHLQTYFIEKGNYLAIRVKDWLTKTHTIKNVFEKLMSDPRCDQSKPCVEIYLNDEEMICLMKEIVPAKKELSSLQKEIQIEFENTAQELEQQFAAFEPADINKLAATGSWTAGQVAEHLIICNSGFVEIITGPVTDTQREPDELVSQIKADFLNFNLKMEASDFVTPPNRDYQQAELLQSFQEIKALLNQAIRNLDLTKTCLTFEVPVYGYLTRLEAVFFVIYHTRRHIQQLKKIYRSITPEKVEATGYSSFTL